MQPLLAQVQSQLQQLQDLQLREPLSRSVSLAICHRLMLRSQGHLTDVQQEHFRQLVQQLLQRLGLKEGLVCESLNFLAHRSHIAQQAQQMAGSSEEPCKL